eukprot:TRINITY_DN4432_c0_g1_i6.p1 TRINITY_DN4432_c0_g1~~TRINITY_DN4432_c0_g1_i6.p1  ORF type:complete len:1156 (+),score=379.42 TRINITY_DN4432_c0_g1_i6:111-3578(+)
MRRGGYRDDTFYDDDDEDDHQRGDGSPDDLLTLDPIEIPTEMAGATLRQMAAGNDVLVFVIERRGGWIVMVYNLRNDSTMTVLEGDKAGPAVHKALIDPTGNHLLVSLTSGENYYVSTMDRTDRDRRDAGKSRPIKCERLKGITVSSVGWDKTTNSTDNSGLVLLGDTQGTLHECRFERREKEGCRHYRKAFDLRDAEGGAGRSGDGATVTGLEMERYGRSGQKLCILAATPSRLYQFVGERSIEQTLATSRVSMRQMPGCAGGDLALYRDRLDTPPKCFAWMTHAGILHGRLDFGSRRQGEGSADSVLQSQEVVPRDDRRRGPTGRPEPGADPALNQLHLPGSEAAVRGLLVSEYNMFVLYVDKVQVLAQPPGLGWRPMGGGQVFTADDIRSRIVWQEQLHHGAKNEGQGILRDPMLNKIYMHTNSEVRELLVPEQAEQRMAWRSCFERALNPRECDRKQYFDLALALSGDTAADQAAAARYDRVQQAKGDYYFDQGEYGAAANIYAQTRKPLEETVLRFTKAREMLSLRDYLEHKIRHTQRTVQEWVEEWGGRVERIQATQLRCLCTLVVQLYLAAMNAADKQNDEDAYEEAAEDFHTFLDAHRELLIGDVIEDLVRNQAPPREYLHFCTVVEAYGNVVSHHVNHGEYQLAVQCLTQHCTRGPHDAQVWYAFSPRLVQQLPRELVAGWMSDPVAKILQPKRLIPALMACIAPPGKTGSPRPQQQQQRDSPTNSPRSPQDPARWAIRYLNWLVHERSPPNEDAAIHNLLISFYAKQPKQQELMDFLRRHAQQPHFDLKYALRICLEEGKDQACVHIYSRMGLYDDAVSLALRGGNAELAKEVAKELEGAMHDCISRQDRAQNWQRQRKLWLHIAQYFVRTHTAGGAGAPAARDGVRMAIQILSECPVNPDTTERLLKLEDILPFFPDFFLIADFNEEICKALENYNKQVRDVIREMDKATGEAAQVRREIEALRHRYGHVEARQPCDLCRHPVLTQNFYLFPACRHVFHMRCLARHVEQNLDKRCAQEYRQRAQGRPRQSPPPVAETSRFSLALGGATLRAAAPPVTPTTPAAASPTAAQSPAHQQRERLRRLKAELERGAMPQGLRQEREQEYDSIVAGECALCGEVQISEIHEPFILAKEADTAEGQSWAVH